jgi:hypothetical protein
MTMRARLATPSLGLFLLASIAMAQSSPATEPTGQKTLAATVGLYVFPAKGQSAEAQSQHEAECYGWAVDSTKVDPFDLGKRAEQQQRSSDAAKQQVAQAGEGAGARGAVAGAAAGALIGEIANNDAGDGAAWGAAVGLIGARRARRRAQQQATQQIERQDQQQRRATAGEIEGFKKAFSVCLEAKKYLVKF